MSDITFYNKNEIVETVGVFKGLVYFKNTRLMSESKKLEREFTSEFKEWFIDMKSKSDGLALHGDENDWWWKPAMRLKYPGIKFPGDEGYENNE